MRNITNKVFAALLLLLAGNGHAQSIDIGARGGVSIPNLTAGSSETNPLNTGYKSRLGADAAIYAAYHTDAAFSVKAMLEYCAEGGKKTGMQAFPVSPEMAQQFPPGQAPQYLYADFSSTARLNYLLLPILANFNWPIRRNNALNAYVNAGPFLGYLVSAKQVTSGNSQVYTDSKGQMPLPGPPQSFDRNNDIRSDLHKFNTGISGNIGLSWRKTRNILFLEAGGNYGFLNIQKGSQNGKNHIGAATIDIGYGYAFLK